MASNLPPQPMYNGAPYAQQQPQQQQQQQFYANGAPAFSRQPSLSSIPPHLQKQAYVPQQQQLHQLSLQQHQQQQMYHHQQIPQQPAPPPIPTATAIPIMTPSNSPHAFQSAYYNPALRQLSQQQLIVERKQSEQRSGGLSYGYGLTGAPILQRILMSLRSGIDSEERWALASLIHSSFNSAEKFSLKYNDVLTNVLLTRIIDAQKANGKNTQASAASVSENIFPFDDTSVSSETLGAQQRTLEALLVIRNFSIESENAEYLGKQKLCRDVVTYGLDTSNYGVNNEYLHYCIEILESISFYIVCTSSEDPLFTAVVGLVQTSSDRSILVPALRSLSRLLIRDEKNIAKLLPVTFVSQQIMRYLLTRDYELLAASLDFLYQYTAHASNISKLVSSSDTLSIVATRQHLVRLLTFGMKAPEADYVRQPRRTPKPVPATPPVLTEEILAELLTYSEPERATQWIRACYENETTGEVTQISLWKAYEAQFEPFARSGGMRLLPAVDFIKNVTSAFQNSAAMVVNMPDGSKRFIIKGIQARAFSVPPSSLKLDANGAPLAGSKGSDAASGAGAGNSSRPPIFGATVALVLQNIGRSYEGKKLLRPVTEDLIKAALLNPVISTYIGDLLAILESPYEEEDDE